MPGPGPKSQEIIKKKRIKHANIVEKLMDDTFNRSPSRWGTGTNKKTGYSEFTAEDNEVWDILNDARWKTRMRRKNVENSKGSSSGTYKIRKNADGSRDTVQTK